MTEKWADYLITAVRFNVAGTHINEVQARTDKGDTAGPAEDKKRQTIVTAIAAGITFCTATKASNGNWQKGAAVKVVTIDGQKFIRTKADGTKADNLDNLPTF